jgi:hypothetical protein
MAEWRPATFTGLADRLREVRSLLAQAAALGAATELERARALGDLVAQDPRSRPPVRLARREPTK